MCYKYVRLAGAVLIFILIMTTSAVNVQFGEVINIGKNITYQSTVVIPESKEPIKNITQNVSMQELEQGQEQSTSQEQSTKQVQLRVQNPYKGHKPLEEQDEYQEVIISRKLEQPLMQKRFQIHKKSRHKYISYSNFSSASQHFSAKKSEMQQKLYESNQSQESKQKQKSSQLQAPERSNMQNRFHIAHNLQEPLPIRQQSQERLEKSNLKDTSYSYFSSTSQHFSAQKSEMHQKLHESNLSRESIQTQLSSQLQVQERSNMENPFHIIHNLQKQGTVNSYIYSVNKRLVDEQLQKQTKVKEHIQDDDTSQEHDTNMSWTQKPAHTQEQFEVDQDSLSPDILRDYSPNKHTLDEQRQMQQKAKIYDQVRMEQYSPIQIQIQIGHHPQMSDMPYYSSKNIQLLSDDKQINQEADINKQSQMQQHSLIQKEFQINHHTKFTDRQKPSYNPVNERLTDEQMQKKSIKNTKSRMQEKSQRQEQILFDEQSQTQTTLNPNFNPGNKRLSHEHMEQQERLKPHIHANVQEELKNHEQTREHQRGLQHRFQVYTHPKERQQPKVQEKNTEFALSHEQQQTGMKTHPQVQDKPYMQKLIENQNTPNPYFSSVNKRLVDVQSQIQEQLPIRQQSQERLEERLQTGERLQSQETPKSYESKDLSDDESQVQKRPQTYVHKNSRERGQVKIAIQKGTQKQLQRQRPLQEQHQIKRKPMPQILKQHEAHESLQLQHTHIRQEQKQQVSNTSRVLAPLQLSHFPQVQNRSQIHDKQAQRQNLYFTDEQLSDEDAMIKNQYEINTHSQLKDTLKVHQKYISDRSSETQELSHKYDKSSTKTRFTYDHSRLQQHSSTHKTENKYFQSINKRLTDEQSEKPDDYDVQKDTYGHSHTASPESSQNFITTNSYIQSENKRITGQQKKQKLSQSNNTSKHFQSINHRFTDKFADIPIPPLLYTTTKRYDESVNKHFKGQQKQQKLSQMQNTSQHIHSINHRFTDKHADIPIPPLLDTTTNQYFGSVNKHFTGQQTLSQLHNTSRHIQSINHRFTDKADIPIPPLVKLTTKQYIVSINKRFSGQQEKENVSKGQKTNRHIHSINHRLTDKYADIPIPPLLKITTNRYFQSVNKRLTTEDNNDQRFYDRSDYNDYAGEWYETSATQKLTTKPNLSHYHQHNDINTANKYTEYKKDLGDGKHIISTSFEDLTIRKNKHRKTTTISPRHHHNEHKKKNIFLRDYQADNYHTKNILKASKLLRNKTKDSVSDSKKVHKLTTPHLSLYLRELKSNSTIINETQNTALNKILKIKTTNENGFIKMAPQILTNFTLNEIYSHPKKIKYDTQINSFMAHVLQSGLKVFASLKDKTIDCVLKTTIDELAQEYEAKYKEFLNDTCRHEIKTRLGKQKVILNTIDVSDGILKRLVNIMVAQMDQKGSLQANIATPTNFQQEVDKITKMHFNHVCTKFGICKTNTGFSHFMVDFITIMLKCDNTQFKMLMDSLTEVTKNMDFSDTFNKKTRHLIKKTIVNTVELLDVKTLRPAFIIIRNIIANKNRPLIVSKSESQSNRINSTLALLEVVDILEDKLPRTDANIIDWGDLKTSLFEWSQNKGSDVTNIMENFVKYLYSAIQSLPPQFQEHIGDNVERIVNVY